MMPSRIFKLTLMLTLFCIIPSGTYFVLFCVVSSISSLYLVFIS